MTVPPHLLTMISDHVRAGRRTFGSHLMRRIVAGLFSARDVERAVLTGTIIEDMPERARCLVCARIRSDRGREIWLHVVCNYRRRDRADLITGYIPDPDEWGDPPIRRQERSGP